MPTNPTVSVKLSFLQIKALLALINEESKREGLNTWEINAREALKNARNRAELKAYSGQ